MRSAVCPGVLAVSLLSVSAGSALAQDPPFDYVQLDGWPQMKDLVGQAEVDRIGALARGALESGTSYVVRRRVGSGRVLDPWGTQPRAACGAVLSPTRARAVIKTDGSSRLTKGARGASDRP